MRSVPYDVACLVSLGASHCVHQTRIHCVPGSDLLTMPDKKLDAECARLLGSGGNHGVVLTLCFFGDRRPPLLNSNEELSLRHCDSAAYANSTHLRIRTIKLEGVERENICRCESHSHRSDELASGGTEKDLLVLLDFLLACGSKLS